MKIIISDKAKRDLFRIYSFVEERSPAAAEKVVARIDRKFGQLTRFPFIGRERFSLAPGLRGVVVGTYLILYAVESDDIVVVRVIDGRMDIDEEFRR